MKKEIEIINEVIELYFEANPTLSIVPVKELMPALIAADVFRKDEKKGKPIRDVLRKLDKTEELHLIPTAHGEEKELGTHWYFVKPGTPKPETAYKQQAPSVKRLEAEQLRLLSDETYIIDLCDTVLQKKAQRQKRFPFLLGDYHKDGRTRTQLPVEAYYASLNLVIEYTNREPDTDSDFDEKPKKKTASGVSRDEQRRIYDSRRAEVLPKHGIQLVWISYESFKLDGSNCLVRNAEKDLKTIETLLKTEGVEMPD